jgi:SAM-dependent methyltransferase
MSDVKSFYDNFTSYMLQGLIYDNPRLEYIKGLLQAVFSERKFRRGLEIGCGIGLLTGTLRKAIPDVLSLDISENNVAVASALIPQGRFLCADFLEMPPEALAGPFDFIGLFDVLEHFPASQHPAVFNRLRELADPGAWVAITIPTAEFLTATRLTNPELLQVVDESIDTVGLLSLAAAAGWSLLHYRRYAIEFEDQYAFLVFRIQPQTLARTPVVVSRSLIQRLTRRVTRDVKALWRRRRYADLLKQSRQ